MNDRLKLHEILCEALGSRNVYFQPPSSIQMKYPAIVYSRSNINKKNANGNPYITNLSYDVTLIDKNPDSPIVKSILEIPYCSYGRHYVSDNLNHDSFTIYY